MFFNRCFRWSWFSVSLVVCLVFLVDPGSSQNLFVGKWPYFKEILKTIDVSKDLTDTVYEKIEFSIWEKITLEKPYPYYIKELADKIQEWEQGQNDTETAQNFLSIYHSHENEEFLAFLWDSKFIDFESDISKKFMSWVQKEEQSERVYEFANTIIDFWEGLITKEMLIAKIQSPRFLGPDFTPSWIEKNKTEPTSHSNKPPGEVELLKEHLKTTWLNLFFPKKKNSLANVASQEDNLWFNVASEYNTFLMNMHIKRSKKLGKLNLILLQRLQLLFNPKKFSAALLEKKEAAPASPSSSPFESLLKDIKYSMISWTNDVHLIEKKFDSFLFDYSKVLYGVCVRDFNDVLDTLYDPGLKDVTRKINVAQGTQDECKMYLWARGIDIQYILKSLSQNEFWHVYLALPIEVNQKITGFLSKDKDFLKNIQRSTFFKKTRARRTGLEIEAWEQFMKEIVDEKILDEKMISMKVEKLTSVLSKTNVYGWTYAQIERFEEIYNALIDEGKTEMFSKFLFNRYHDFNLNEAVERFLENLPELR